MKCGTFELQRIACAVAEVLTAHNAKECASCDTPLTSDLKTYNGVYFCPVCDAAVCIVCGCTEDNACIGGCSWLEPGLCSTHKPELQAALGRYGVRMPASY